MASLLRCLELQGSSGFKVQIIEDQGKNWIRLSSLDVADFFGFWSESDAEEKATIEEVLWELSKRLRLLTPDKESKVKEAIKYWPKGWEFWSFGLPGPLSDYLSYEFQDDLSKLAS